MSKQTSRTSDFLTVGSILLGILCVAYQLIIGGYEESRTNPSDYITFPWKRMLPKHLDHEIDFDDHPEAPPRTGEPPSNTATQTRNLTAASCNDTDNKGVYIFIIDRSLSIEKEVSTPKWYQEKLDNLVDVDWIDDKAASPLQPRNGMVKAINAAKIRLSSLLVEMTNHPGSQGECFAIWSVGNSAESIFPDVRKWRKGHRSLARLESENTNLALAQLMKIRRDSSNTNFIDLFDTLVDLYNLDNPSATRPFLILAISDMIHDRTPKQVPTENSYDISSEQDELSKRLRRMRNQSIVITSIKMQGTHPGVEITTLIMNYFGENSKRLNKLHLKEDLSMHSLMPLDTSDLSATLYYDDSKLTDRKPINKILITNRTKDSQLTLHSFRSKENSHVHDFEWSLSRYGHEKIEKNGIITTDGNNFFEDSIRKNDKLSVSYAGAPREARTWPTDVYLHAKHDAHFRTYYIELRFLPIMSTNKAIALLTLQALILTILIWLPLLLSQRKTRPKKLPSTADNSKKRSTSRDTSSAIIGHWEGRQKKIALSFSTDKIVTYTRPGISVNGRYSLKDDLILIEFNHFEIVEGFEFVEGLGRIDPVKGELKVSYTPERNHRFYITYKKVRADHDD